MNPAAEVWEKVKVLMGSEMTATTMNTWFDDAEAVSLEESRFVLYSPTRFKRDIIAARYASPIQNALRELFSSDFQLTVLTEDQLTSFQDGPKQSDFLPGTEEYTFDRFVVGSSNKFAHAAARKAAENPGMSYNPLFIYGASGLGKTHLLYSIAHTITRPIRTSKSSTSRGTPSPTNLSPPSGRAETRIFGTNTGERTYFSWTTYSSSPAGTPPRRRCFTPSTCSMS